jgi:hypothetical protein
MIRFTFTYLKPVALLLSIVVLFQSCKAFNKKPSSIQQAIGYEKKWVKIITNDNKKFILDSIYHKSDEKLYGLTAKKIVEKIDTTIPTEQIENFEENLYQNKTNNIIKTTDGKEYIFESYYYTNDTVFGKQIVKRQKELLFPLDSIKEIHLYNPKKSTTKTVFLVIGSAALGFIIVISIDAYIVWSKDYPGAWF